MRIVMVVNYCDSLLAFRGRLLEELTAAGHEVTACAPGENAALAAELQKIGVGYRHVRLQRTGTNPFRDLRFFLEMLVFFARHRPDVVISYTIKPVIYCSLAARLARVPRIFSVVTGLGYAFIGSSGKRRLLKMLVSGLYRSALSCNRTVFFLNRDDLATFVDGGILADAGKVRLIDGEGVDLGHYCRGTEEPSPQISFLLIARLIADKGVLEYVQAARLVKRKYPEAVFRLLGPFDSNPAAIQECQVRRWGEEGVVEYLGETDDVRPYIASSSVYVLPSYREGLPRTVLEAMAMGLPVITTDAPGCRETVRENGFLVPVRDPLALAEAMEKFIRNPALIERMGEASRAMVEERFDVRKINSLFVEAMGL